ncbi:hypothetical protein CA13_62260 [Planctomycetes bacterium CA13]|uniref:Uncharacterized protein n=1 Tax=Novipirellula herctigrandis TaxID=2527986 RepID=A0A5C5ZC78_9BACT|nr:hypothetical protein CA13_62260 [Planctomycetes bacterium CA13]
MDRNDRPNDDEDKLPDDVADAWAAVLIDVHEKTKDKATTAAAEDTDRMPMEALEKRRAKNEPIGTKSSDVD